VPIAAYFNSFADALTPCALFAIGLGLTAEGMRSNLAASVALTVVKLVTCRWSCTACALPQA
jgi:malonate transporter